MAASHAVTKLLIHGGAGIIRRDMDGNAETEVRSVLSTALVKGFAWLHQGGSAVDAVVAAVMTMEDSPEFNAGRGAVYTHEGTHELDAAVMDGASLNAGAVTCISSIRNPVLLARAVMEHSSHVLLAGAGAENFAREHDIATVDPSYFDTVKRRRQWQEALRQQTDVSGPPDHFGTVGAVALDTQGHLAAATSTGGMTNKFCGRVGDTPIIGAGTYANAACAVSATGWGEFYIRSSTAHAICMRTRAMPRSLRAIAHEEVNQTVCQLGGSGGAIVLGADGDFAFPFNTSGMFRGWIGGEREPRPHVAIWREER